MQTGPRGEWVCLGDDGNLAVDGEAWDEAVIEHMMPPFSRFLPSSSWELWWAVAGEMWLMHAMPRGERWGTAVTVAFCSCHGESESESEILLQRT